MERTIEVLKQLYHEEMNKVIHLSKEGQLSVPLDNYEKEFEFHKERADVLDTLIHDLVPAPED